MFEHVHAWLRTFPHDPYSVSSRYWPAKGASLQGPGCLHHRTLGSVVESGVNDAQTQPSPTVKHVSPGSTRSVTDLWVLPPACSKGLASLAADARRVTLENGGCLWALSGWSLAWNCADGGDPG